MIILFSVTVFLASACVWAFALAFFYTLLEGAFENHIVRFALALLWPVTAVIVAVSLCFDAGERLAQKVENR